MGKHWTFNIELHESDTRNSILCLSLVDEEYRRSHLVVFSFNYCKFKAVEERHLVLWIWTLLVHFHRLKAPDVLNHLCASLWFACNMCKWSTELSRVGVAIVKFVQLTIQNLCDSNEVHPFSLSSSHFLFVQIGEVFHFGLEWLPMEY